MIEDKAPHQELETMQPDYTDAQLEAGLSALRNLREQLGKHLSDETLCGCVYDAMRGNAPPAERDVLAERRRQIEQEGWLPEHDDEHHSSEELAIAAACYALNATWLKHIGQTELVQKYWPWDVSWWKPKDPRRDLVRAAALIVAEIERLDRANPPA